jgi:hypothetical protein
LPTGCFTGLSGQDRIVVGFYIGWLSLQPLYEKLMKKAGKKGICQGQMPFFCKN